MSEIGDLEAEGAKRTRFPLVANTRVYEVTLDPGEIIFFSRWRGESSNETEERFSQAFNSWDTVPATRTTVVAPN